MAVVQPPVIIAPPTRPDRADRDTFADRADAWTIWERDHQVPEMGAVAANVAGNASDAAASAAAASASAGAVSAAAVAAANSASSAAGSATAAGASAMSASGSAATAGTKSAAAEAARAAAVLAQTAAAASAATALELRNQTQALRNDAQAIAGGDILGTAPDKFSNNEMMDAKIDAVVATSLPKAGGIMTGPLVLEAAPTAPMQAANKAWVEEKLEESASAKIGDIKQAVVAPDETWMLCQGGVLLTAAYPALYEKIGLLPNTYAIVAPSISDELPATLPGNAAYTSMIYANGQFLVLTGGKANLSTLSPGVGAASTALYTSPDGVKWTRRTMPQSYAWTSITYGAGKYVAVSTYASGIGWQSRVATSVDSITWTLQTTPGFATGTLASQIVFGNGIFVITSNNCTYTSADAVNWTMRNSLAASCDMIAFGNGIFVALATDAGGVYSSTNGVVWESQSVAIAGSGSYRTPLVFAKDYFFILSGSDRRYLYSSNGVSWTTGYFNDDLVPRWVGYVNGRYVMGAHLSYYGSPGGFQAGGTGTSFSPWNDNFASSETLMLALPRTSTATQLARIAGTSWFTGSYPSGANTVTYGAGKYVALPGAGGNSWFSNDAVNWQMAALPRNRSWTCVRYGGGRFIAVAGGEANQIFATSIDGIAWTEFTVPVSASWTSLAYGAGVWIACGGVNVLRSVDGLTWSATAPTGLVASYHVQHGTERGFVVTTGGGQNSTQSAWSADGLVWTLHTLPGTAAPWGRLAFGNGMFMVLGAGSTSTRAASSVDGRTWATVVLPTGTPVWSAIAFGNGLFSAFAYNAGNVITSTDGAAWTERGTGALYTQDAAAGPLGIAIASGGAAPAVSLISYDKSTEFALPNLAISAAGATPLYYYIKTAA